MPFSQKNQLLARKVHRMPERWKIGWVHGFYSCGFADDSLDDGASLLPGGCLPVNSPADVRLYWAGYKAGRKARQI